MLGRKTDKTTLSMADKKLPMVGIFWMYNRRLLGNYAENMSEAYDDGLFINVNMDHYGFWSYLVKNRLLPHELMRCGYERVPRGRIIYYKDEDGYHILGTCLEIMDAHYQNLIIECHNLLSKKCVFQGDFHYEHARMVR